MRHDTHWYWHATSLPELADLPMRERVRLLAKYWWKPYRHWQTWVSPVSIMLLFGAFIWWANSIKHSPMWTVTVGVTVALAAGALGFIHKQVVLSWMRPYLRAAVGGLCLQCGYDIRASDARCPECGTPVPTTPTGKAVESPSPKR